MDMKTDIQEPQKMLPEGKKTAWAQWAWALVAVAVVGVGVYFLTAGDQKQDVTGGQMGTSTIALADNQVAQHHYEWTFAPAGGNSMNGAYMNTVTLTVDGQAHDVGTYEGNCTVLGANASWALMTNELTGVICYFAGAGDEVGVFAEGAGYVVKHGTLNEGSAEIPGTRGSYTTLFSL